MPYAGIVEVTVDFAEIGVDNGDSCVEKCLFLIVPSTVYNAHIPILVGTNILGILMDWTEQRFGPTFLRCAKLTTPLYLALRCILIRERELSRRNNQLAIVRCASSTPVTIRPNSDVVLEGSLSKKINYPVKVCALIQLTDRSAIPADLDLTPLYRTDLSATTL